MSHAYWLLNNLVLVDSLVLCHWLLSRRGPERQLVLVWSLCLHLLPVHELSRCCKIVCLVNLHSILNSSICELAKGNVFLPNLLLLEGVSGLTSRIDVSMGR